MAAQRKPSSSGKVMRSRRTRKTKEKRVVLFPAEPSVVGFDKIMAAIEAVRAERKAKK